MSFWKKIRGMLKKWWHGHAEQEEEKGMEWKPVDSPTHTLEPFDHPLSPLVPHLTDSDLPYVVMERFHDSKYWTWTERIRGHQDLLAQEKFIPEIVRKDEELIRHFGSSEPSSTDILLHYLSAAKKPSHHPVLLVHGAGHDANLAWCQSPEGQAGIVSSLSSSGRDVFAITYAHSHGDNWQQAIGLANGIKRIMEITSVDKIDLIAHSKGGIPVWIYLAGLCGSWDAEYEGEVDRCILLGTPNRGLDFPFRHATANWSVIQMGISAPVACDSMLYFGKYIDTTGRSLYLDGGAFPGSSQLLYRWDDRLPVGFRSKTLYYGGQNMFLHSRGIDTAIREGGYLMEKLLSSPMDEQIQIHVLAGNQPYFHGVRGEQDGESDGLVLVDSVLYTDGMAPNTNRIMRKDILPLNHLELLYHPDAHHWILEGL
ncbi:MAG TPA: acetyltransferase [Bacillota bacterium]|nr:acetyltransferase [Bacillota bacterium]